MLKLIEPFSLKAVKAMGEEDQGLPRWAQTELWIVRDAIDAEGYSWSESIPKGDVPNHHTFIGNFVNGPTRSPENLHRNFMHYVGMTRTEEAVRQGVFEGPYEIEIGFNRKAFQMSVASSQSDEKISFERKIHSKLFTDCWSVMGEARDPEELNDPGIIDEFRAQAHGELTNEVDKAVEGVFTLGKYTVKNIAAMALILHPSRRNPFRKNTYF